MGERTYLNMLEQQPIFLVALWMCAAFISAPFATWLGGFAVFFRACYPVMWSLGPNGTFSWKVELSTQPYYLCVMGMLGTVAIWAFSGVNLAHDVHPGAAAGCLIGLWNSTSAGTSTSGQRSGGKS